MMITSAALTGCSAPPVTPVIPGSGSLETRKFDRSFFTHVSVSGGFKVNVKETDAFSVSITADDNMFNYLDVRKKDNTLFISLKPGSYNNVELRAEVGVSDLRGISVSGGVTGTVMDFASRNPMDFNVSGGSSLTGQIGFGNSKAVVSGGSTLELGGTADDINLTVSGGSTFRAQNLYATNITANVSGGSMAQVNASGTLNADASGASRLTYRGSPTLGKIVTHDVSSVGHQ
jgi:hypothetical protein